MNYLMQSFLFFFLTKMNPTEMVNSTPNVSVFLHIQMTGRHMCRDFTHFNDIIRMFKVVIG